MQRNPLLFLSVLFVAVLLSQTTGCTPSHRTPPRIRPKIIAPPSSLDIRLKIRHWQVVDHRILDYDSLWGHFRLVGRFAYLGNLVFKIKSDKFRDHYWLVKIPSVETGTHEVRASIYLEPSRELQPTESPEQFTIAVLISDGIVESHVIQNPHPGWGEFIVDRYRNGILYIRNSFYPNSIWKAQMPRDDGRWTVHAILDKSHN